MSAALPGTPSQRRVIYTVGLVALFRYLFEFTWPQVAVVTGIVLVGESTEIGRTLPGVDERHARLTLGFVVFAAGTVVWLGSGDPFAVGAFAAGGWLALDALYSLRAGIRTGETDAQPSSGEAMRRMQDGHRVATELEDGPKTVAELTASGDLPEARVRAALDYHERAGTAYREGDRWVLDESKTGFWPFVRDNARRVGYRLTRPFRLFVP